MFINAIFVTIMLLFGCLVGIDIGEKSAKKRICQQAYKAQVIDAIPACKEWKEDILKQLDGKK